MFRHILSCWGAATLIVTPALFVTHIVKIERRATQAGGFAKAA